MLADIFQTPDMGFQPMGLTKLVNNYRKLESYERMFIYKNSDFKVKYMYLLFLVVIYCTTDSLAIEVRSQFSISFVVKL